MRRRVIVGQEVGIDLLLACSDAFRYLADELAAEYARRYESGAGSEGLDWAQCLAEISGWWSGRLETEADYVAGFDAQVEVGMRESTPTAAEARLVSECGNSICRRRRPRRPPG